MVFSCINIRQVPREVLKTETGGRDFQLLRRDLANVNALKTIFSRYYCIKTGNICYISRYSGSLYFLSGERKQNNVA